MLKQLKSKLDQATERLGVLRENLEDRFDDLDDASEALWDKTRLHLQRLERRLEEASGKAEEALDVRLAETELQVHLAAMDARDQWQQVEGAVTQLSRKLKHSTAEQLDHARLQGHLAKLDADDFMVREGKQLSEDFYASKTKVEQLTLQAATQLQQKFEGVIDGLPRF